MSGRRSECAPPARVTRSSRRGADRQRAVGRMLHHCGPRAQPFWRRRTPPRRDRSCCGPAGSTPARRSIARSPKSIRSGAWRVASDACAKDPRKPQKSTGRGGSRDQPRGEVDMTVERAGKPQRVGDHQQAAAGSRDQLAGEREHAVRGRFIQIARGFVREQEQWSHRQRAPDRDPLLLAARQLLGIAVGEPAKCQSLRELGLPGRIVTAGNAGLKGEVVPHVETGDQVELLKNQAKPIAPQRRQSAIAEIGNRRIGYPDLAAVRAIEARDQMQQRALAAAGFASKRDALAACNAQIHAAQDRDLFSGGTIGLGQVADAEHDLVAVGHAKRVTFKELWSTLTLPRPWLEITVSNTTARDRDHEAVQKTIRQRRQAGAIRPICPVALSDLPWLASPQGHRSDSPNREGTTMIAQPTPKGAWKITFMLFLFMLVNFADKIVVGLAGVPIMTEMKLEPEQFGLL